MCTAECESWDFLCEPGTLRINAATRSLEVLQSRRVHAEVASRLAGLRARKQRAMSRGRELDLPSLLLALDKDDGIFPDDQIRSDVLVIGNPRDDRLVVGERDFAGVDELIEFLGRQPRRSLRAGIFLGELFHIKGDLVGTRVSKLVTQFCESRDVDLFVKPTSIAWGPIDRRTRWTNRASDSVYDPD
ncbi:MAG TPA: hypothetical protein VKU82_10880 [Planctomycetaceae bacterium]|nr:hypothetical protein [Planctomycetaceae bacterium]